MAALSHSVGNHLSNVALASSYQSAPSYGVALASIASAHSIRNPQSSVLFYRRGHCDGGADTALLRTLSNATILAAQSFSNISDDVMVQPRFILLQALYLEAAASFILIMLGTIRQTSS